MDELRQNERVAVARLHALLELLPSTLDRELAAAGVTAFEYTLLEALGEAERGRLRLSALAARANATLPRLSRVVTALERRGLVQRAACEEDGRATNAVLTDAGRATYEHSRPAYANAVRGAILRGLDASAVASLSDLAYTMLVNLDPDGRLDVTAAGASRAADPTLRPAKTAADAA